MFFPYYYEYSFSFKNIVRELKRHVYHAGSVSTGKI